MRTLQSSVIKQAKHKAFCHSFGNAEVKSHQWEIDNRLC